MLDTPARGLSSLTPVPSITCPAFFPTCTLLLSSVGTRSARKTQSPSKASRAMSLQGRSLATQGPQLAPAFARIRAPKLRASPAEHNAGSSSSNSKDVVVEELSYRPNVGVCIVNSQGLVWAGQRCDDVLGTWQMPQGGIDDGEEPHVAALREVTEETSIKSARIVGELDRWLHYDFPTKVRQRLHGGWLRYKGQKQKWFLAQFTGEDSEISLDTEHREFKQWQWMPLEELPGSVVEFKREVYTEVAKEFGPLIQQLRLAGWQVDEQR